ncbi:uncharacterized protein LOC122253188, partial [Penaeus japonicus]|uniref:uncharacterized protein LOC122253188 n=1 Tax=Penaeus japonicus TaxID=27405 RepID=UPI001C714C97
MTADEIKQYLRDLEAAGRGRSGSPRENGWVGDSEATPVSASEGRRSSSWTLLSGSLLASTLLGLMPTGRGLGSPGTWWSPVTLASATVVVFALVTLVAVVVNHVACNSTMQSYTDVQLLAESVYIVVIICVPAGIALSTWRSSFRIL